MILIYRLLILISQFTGIVRCRCFRHLSILSVCLTHDLEFSTYRLRWPVLFFSKIFRKTVLCLRFCRFLKQRLSETLSMFLSGGFKFQFFISVNKIMYFHCTLGYLLPESSSSATSMSSSSESRPIQEPCESFQFRNSKQLLEWVLLTFETGDRPDIPISR